MPAPELRLGNRTAYFRKALCTPDFRSESVLTRDPFQFTSLWLKRHCKEAIPYWQQAAHYYEASKTLPPQSSPLTSYYCFLNATKALLIVKGRTFAERHGVSGEFDPTSKRTLSNEVVKIGASGIMAELTEYLGEPETAQTHKVTDLLANLAFIHRAYRHTFKAQRELFIPLKNLVYRKHPTDRYVWFTAEIGGRLNDAKTLKTLPHFFEVDAGYNFKDKSVIRTRSRSKWHERVSPKTAKIEAMQRLHSLHRKVRLHVQVLSAPLDLWYLKRNVSGTKRIDRYNLTIIMALMHRLSELSRYDPKGLAHYLDSRANWLLTEFIELAPAQFLDELICEMTSLEIRLPGIRP